MRLKYFLLSILAVAIIGSFVVALDQQRRSAILIPTLSLTQANVGGSLLGDLINGVSVFQYSASASVQGVTIVRDVHNMPRCPSDATTATTVIGSQAPGSTDRFWLYEYSGNEQANNQAGLTGRDLFDGKFYISDGEFASATNDAIRTALYESLHTLTEISPGKVYYVMSALDLSFSCGDGVEMAQGGGGGSSSSTSSSVSSSDPNLVTLRATLDADEAVPPTTSIAVGTGTATYHTVTKEFNYVLTNTVAETGDTITGVYIRRAPVGQTGSSVFYTVQSGVTLDISLGLGDFDFGGTTLTTTQANDLLSGLWYFDIRTAAHPNGAIRGQMLVVSGGSTGSGSSSISSGSGSSSVSSGTGSSSISSGSGSSSISAGSGSSSVSSGSGSCTPIACPGALPVGCSYENPTFENGCQTDCGTLVCEGSSSSSSSAVTCPMGTTCSIIELCTSGTVGEECGQSIGFQHVCCVPFGASSSSVSALCGNGTLDAGEECDDGNLIDGDGCFSNCASMIPPSSFSAFLPRWLADLHSFLTNLF